MATSELHAASTGYQISDTDEDDEACCSDSDSDYDPDDSDDDGDGDRDGGGGVPDDAHSQFSELSIKNTAKSRARKNVDRSDDAAQPRLEASFMEIDEKEDESAETVLSLVHAGQLEKLKVEQCKAYLRKNGLRLTGNKETLIQRIKEHIEIFTGKGEEKYPVSSFVLRCKGDACTGDVVMFEQNVYELFNIASRSASGPPCGKRIVAGRIVKESYGAAKQQHTFTTAKKEINYPICYDGLIPVQWDLAIRFNFITLPDLTQKVDDLLNTSTDQRTLESSHLTREST